MVVDEKTLGRFRGNPQASVHNNLKRVDLDNPGTPATDANAVGIDASAASKWEGITYTGKDGVSTFLRFFTQQYPDGNHFPIDIDVSEGNDALRDAILNVISLHEVHPKVSVTGLVGAVIVTHVGSGTLASVRLDGSDEALARVAF